MVSNLDLTQLWHMRIEHMSHVVKFKLVSAIACHPLEGFGEECMARGLLYGIGFY